MTRLLLDPRASDCPSRIVPIQDRGGTNGRSLHRGASQSRPWANYHPAPRRSTAIGPHGSQEPSPARSPADLIPSQVGIRPVPETAVFGTGRVTTPQINPAWSENSPSPSASRRRRGPGSTIFVPRWWPAGARATVEKAGAMVRGGARRGCGAPMCPDPGRRQARKYPGPAGAPAGDENGGQAVCGEPARPSGRRSG